MTLHLTEAQRSLLLELIEAAHREKLHELHHTDAAAYKVLLRERITSLEALTAMLVEAEQTV